MVFVNPAPCHFMHHKLTSRRPPSITWIEAHTQPCTSQCTLLTSPRQFRSTISGFAVCPFSIRLVVHLSLHDSPSYMLRMLLSAHCKAQPSTNFHDGVPWCVISDYTTV
ncbi:hypothetical protein BYT27DRAFT_6519764 [Phlegmacium glaucopus]|nr:hypothetical protein BYT27DRAFT_6519764 [Phlegmacium glaucopus]